MQRITALWNKGLVGKAAIVLMGLVVVCCVLGALIGRGGSQQTASQPTARPAAAPTIAPDAPTEPPAPTSVPEPTDVPTATPEPTPLPGIGAQVNIEEMSWIVEEAVEAGDRIETENQFVEPRVTAGKFIRVRVAIQNQGNTEQRVTAGSMEIVDSQGRTFKASTSLAVSMIVGNENACTFQDLPAGVPKVCRLIFEVPKDASGFKFKATNLALVLVDEVLIDLGF